MRRAAVALVILLLLAGCAGNGKKDPVKDADFGSLSLAPTADTGIVRGVVVDLAIRPLANVQVGLSGAGGITKSTNTSADGLFGFDGLPAGTYFLKAHRAGYLDAQQSVDVVAGVASPAPSKILLQVDVANQPYFEGYVFDGFLECGVTAVATQVAVCLAPNLFVPNATNENTQVTYPIANRPMWAQTEMVWEATQAAGNDLTLEYSYNGGCGLFCDHQVNGTSPLLLTADQATLGVILANDTGLYTRVFSDDVDATQPPTNQCTPVPDPVLGAVYCSKYGVGATLEQKFSHYTHIFYGYVPTPGWRFTSGEPVPLPPA